MKPNLSDKTFGLLAFNGLEELDLIGPWEIFSLWQQHQQGPRQVILVAEQNEMIRCAKGLRIAVDNDFHDCPPLDYLLIPGGIGTRREVDNPLLIDFIKQQARHCEYILSVCTGALLLRAAGCLQGKKATTHWNSFDVLAQDETITAQQQRYIHDGNIWTSAGISAGIDMAFAFVAQVAGETVAGQIQQFAEYYPETKCYAPEHQDLPAYVVQL